ncbi:MlaE family lipid ABC transporter permease subunit [Nitratidesulfovibrio sp. D1]|uniref:ABC transporter permease n=1 Tax=Nitratidesulfovibrio sp. D1 TaxID=3440151 RepID=UPI003EB8A5AC
MRETVPPFREPTLKGDYRRPDPDAHAGPHEPGLTCAPAAPGMDAAHGGAAEACAREQVFTFSGAWEVGSIGRMTARLLRRCAEVCQSCGAQGDAPVVHLDLSGVTRLDTAGAQLLCRAAANMAAAGAQVAWRVPDPGQSVLLDRVRAIDISVVPRERRVSPVLGALHAIGGSIVEELEQARSIVGFLGMFLVSLAASVARPWRLRWVSIVHHMEQTGIQAVPIVALLTFLIGLVTAYMGSEQFTRFGAQVFVVNLIEVSTLRELGVLLTALIVAGRSGSSFTAQIGAMVANEEVDAMRSMGLDPMEVLVIPRVVALVLMLPVLTFIADFMGVLGGGIASWLSLGISPGAFAVRFQEITRLTNFVTGLVKAPFFALIIGIVGCFQGFRVTGSAESVGRLTTQAVVESIFLVIVANAGFAILFMSLGV